METRRWTNPSQPQTLYSAVFLLYINAAFSLLFGNAVAILLGFIGVVLVVAGSVGAGFGIANERKWGYMLGVAIASVQLVPFLIVLATDGIGSVFSVRFLLAIIFPVALFALLIHPMSRDYQRVWFK
jgi:hypothetical protein